ncbi:MAG: SpoIIE family protein phosphatase, partial [Gammaproteobacteria bacterium]|nr:SpoIIE family protein phosphatase [Gammaproteobacteria bacterium]
INLADDDACSDRDCYQQQCPQSDCLDEQSLKVKWLSLEATITQISNEDNNVVLFDDDTEQKDVNFNGNLIDITEAKFAHAQLLKQQNEIQQINQHTRESIEYAALIQGALIPDELVFNRFFKENFTIWQPKDIVGGDIYLAEPINKNELIMMLIDCTGHGVPGAFVTMLVKAVERQIIANIHKDEFISPAKILTIFNKSIKHLLKQDDIQSVSNAGFDGGILYYNSKEKIVRFAGAYTPLFYMQEGELKIIKGNRHSIGYKKSDIDYQFKEHTIDVSIPTKIYLTSDGYLDQNGGEKGFSLGTKRFKQFLQTVSEQALTEQKDYLLSELTSYQGDEERNDDVTVIGLHIDNIADIQAFDTIEILNYHGVITQNFISTCTDNLDVRITNISFRNKISTILIELCQNIKNYAKTNDKGSRQLSSTGLIEVLQTDHESYEVSSHSIIAIEDKAKIERKLIEIQSMDRQQIRKRYRELRKAGTEKHDKGAGIGFYEIAKLVKNVEYKFKRINDDKYDYYLKLSL